MSPPAMIGSGILFFITALVGNVSQREVYFQVMLLWIIKLSCWVFSAFCWSHGSTEFPSFSVHFDINSTKWLLKFFLGFSPVLWILVFLTHLIKNWKRVDATDTQDFRQTCSPKDQTGETSKDDQDEEVDKLWKMSTKLLFQVQVLNELETLFLQKQMAKKKDCAMSVENQDKEKNVTKLRRSARIAQRRAKEEEKRKMKKSEARREKQTTKKNAKKKSNGKKKNTLKQEKK
jgi:hypothetical protein